MTTGEKMFSFGVGLILAVLVCLVGVAVVNEVDTMVAAKVGRSDAIVQVRDQVLVQPVEKALVRDGRAVLYTTAGKWNLPAESVVFVPSGSAKVGSPANE